MAADQLRAISYGGGVQSTAMIVLAVQGKIPADVALFSNVGDDSEHPATLSHVRDVMIPWAESQGFPIHELSRRKRDGTTETLYGQLTKPGSRSVGIPVRMSNGAPGNRSCTADFKIRVVNRWLRQHGASEANPAIVHIGISTDEIQRVSNRRPDKFTLPTYPLIELGLSRSDCQSVIASAGIPVPGKSSCYFCPFHRPQAWAEMARDEPDLFEKSCNLEDHLNTVRRNIGKDPVHFTRFGVPLRSAIGPAQDMLPGFASADMDTCDSGYCWT